MTTDRSDLEDFRRRLCQGEDEALAELFARYREPLRRLVIMRLDSRLNTRVSPSDILQEVYLDAAQRLHHYRAKPDQSLFGWLRLLVRQRLHDVCRRHLEAQTRAVGQEVPLDRGAGPATSSQGLAAQLAAHLPSPSQEAMRHEVIAQLEATLERMDEMDREVLVLRHFEELNNKDTALALGIPPSAASKRYVRALARLKEIMEGLPGFASALRQPTHEAKP
jgi:RNA polymerase sigma-70 factor (ECF subfamily)